MSTGWSTAQQSTLRVGQVKAQGTSTIPVPARSKRWVQWCGLSIWSRSPVKQMSGCRLASTRPSPPSANWAMRWVRSAVHRVDTDVVAAAEQLRRRGADRIVLVGSSMGGTAVLSAATRIRPPVAGVVSLSGPSGFDGVDARAAMRRLRVPVLLVVGADDRPFNAQARTLYAAARFRDKQLLVVPGRVHGTGMLELGDEAPKVLAAVRGFIDDRTGH